MGATFRTTTTHFLALAFLALPACNCAGPPNPSGPRGIHTTTSGSTTTGGTSGSPGCGLVTCASAGAQCGPLGDGCGDILQCGSCPDGEYCGGGGSFKCGVGSSSSTSSSGGPCTGLCLDQITCDGGATTSVSGTVFAPTNPSNGFGDPDPLPNATVYIANGTPDPFTPGVACDVCGAPVSGDPLVLTTSMEDGGFVLSNVPVNDGGFNLVVQLGRWRRTVPIPPVKACTNTVLTPDQTRLPRNHNEGDIPLTAMVTGSVDSIECVLRKMGVDDAEFQNPGDAGRIQLYLSDTTTGDTSNAGEAAPAGHTPAESALTTDPIALANYDLVIFACVGAQIERTGAEQDNLVDYANAGGRVYATHFSYVWLYDNQPFESTAAWDTNQGSDTGPEQIQVNTGFAKGAELGDWLQIVGASPTPDVIPLGVLRHDFDGANAPAENWLTYQPSGHNAAAWPIHYTFNTPVDTDGGPECGRVVFSDFHVEDESNSSTNGETFPSACQSAPMTPQEKVLEFMLFDLSSCVTQCSALTCAQLGYTCGATGDGCGNVINCGVYDAGTCGGAFVANQCGTPSFE